MISTPLLLALAVAQTGPDATAATKAAVVATLERPAARPSPPTCQAPLPFTRKNGTLQRNLEAALASVRLHRYTQRHRLSVAVVDVTHPDELAYAGVNDDDMVYAASLPKIAILLADAQAAADGRLTWTEEHDRRLSAMITESSNDDATWGAGLVGFAGIEQEMRDLVHGATARQAARFYALLDNHDLVSREWSDRLLALMGPPKHHHKFVKGLEDRPGAVFVARKSGTWLDYHADSALIQHGDRRYIVVALSELRNGEDVMQKVVRIVDDLIVAGKHRKPRPPTRAALPVKTASGAPG